MTLKTITVRQGDDFYINHSRAVVVSLVNGSDVTLQLAAQTVAVNKDDWTTIPVGSIAVDILLGDSKTNRSKSAKLRIRFSEPTKVLRGKQYRETYLEGNV